MQVYIIMITFVILWGNKLQEIREELKNTCHQVPLAPVRPAGLQHSFHGIDCCGDDDDRFCLDWEIVQSAAGLNKWEIWN